LGLFQNPVSFEQALRKTGQKPGFSIKSKEAGQAKPVSPKLKFWNSLNLFFKRGNKDG
jgi:hypothetical protein